MTSDRVGDRGRSADRSASSEGDDLLIEGPGPIATGTGDDAIVNSNPGSIERTTQVK